MKDKVFLLDYYGLTLIQRIDWKLDKVHRFVANTYLYLLSQDFEGEKSYEEVFEMRTDILNEDGSIDERFLVPQEDMLDYRQSSSGLVINVFNPHAAKNEKKSKY